MFKNQDGVVLVQFTGRIDQVNSDSHRRVKVSEKVIFSNLLKRDTETHPSICSWNL
jgi:hypothetical protein